MRQPLHARYQTFALRVVYPAVFGGLAFLWVVGYALHPITMGASRIPGILICCGMLVYAFAVTLLGRRFDQVWLDGDVLEVRRRKGVVRLPMADISMVELVRSRPNYIRLRFKGRAPIRFIPVDASGLDGGGERTRKQLKDLVNESTQ